MRMAFASCLDAPDLNAALASRQLAVSTWGIFRELFIRAGHCHALQPATQLAGAPATMDSSVGVGARSGVGAATRRLAAVGTGPGSPGGTA